MISIPKTLKKLRVFIKNTISSIFSIRMQSDIHDPFKPLDQIFEPDERQKNFLLSFEDTHHLLSSIVLNQSIPVDVRQMFETAKNVSLYSYFAYRFHQVSEMTGFSALEFGLKELCKSDPDLESVPHGLGKLLRHAKKRGWINNGFFRDKLKEATINGIRLELHNQADKEMEAHGKITTNPYREITEQEILDGLKRSVAVDGLIYLIQELRNNLAHGSITLHPNSISSLSRTAEILNYIYTNHNLNSQNI